ncbi:hypothetical protein [Sphingobacterium bovisgrunnientis]|uniref:hypothetical protein n=1 Tax=Sphingobacterium bovisgrunnientis TaxID=1874697 RepID=UPI001358B69D|nr:hypothetical protein [Sphingobacterium bovisgrunnientis]
MMNKFNFTPEGVENSNAYFYSLSNAELQAVIQQVQTNIKQWVIDYFYLSVEQITWMNNLDNEFLFLLSNQLALTMAFKLPYYLVKPKKNDGTTLGVKRGSSHNPIDVSTNSAGEVIAHGSLTFTISY